MPKPKKTILIIGASPPEFASWRQYLHQADHNETWLCQEADHPNKCEQDYLTHQPDCVVLADSLPDVDIMATLAQLQSVAGANLAPVLIITAAGQEKKAQEALKNGAANYLFKADLTARGLRSAVYAALRQEELRRERDSLRDSVENAAVRVHWSEKSLHEAEEEFRALVEASSQAIWRAGPNGQDVEDFAWWENLTGQTREQFTGEGYLAVLHPEDREQTKSAWATALATKTLFANEYRVLNRQGNYQYFAVRGVPMFNPDGSIREWIGTFTDINERKQAEGALERQARLIDLSSEPILVWDVEQGIVEWNAGAAQLYGFTKQEAVGRTSHELLQTTHPLTFEALIKTLKESGEWAGDLHHKTKDGREVTVESRHQLININGRQLVLETNHDITERKQQKRLVQDTFDYVENIIATLREPFIVLSKDLRVKTANRSFYEIFHVSPEETQHQFIYDLGNRQWDIPALRTLLEEVLSDHHPVHDYEVEHDFPTIGQKIMLLNALRIRQPGNHSELILLAIEDITERKQAKIQLEQAYLVQTAARAEAEAANRAKDEFLAVVSHELRAPLNAMLGWAKILKGGNYTPATLEHAIEVIERSARSQQKMIEDLLDSARIISGKLRLEIQSVEMTSVIAATLETVRPAAQAKGLTLEVSCPPGTGIITGDAERLQQVVWNLLSNAVKFTPHGGRISVRLERVDPYLQLIVSDTGKGINRDFMPYIFNRFHQADSSITRRHSGLGLGLSLVRHLVELHGGTVKAESPGEEKGATFTVTLPFRAVRTAVDEAALPNTHRNGASNLTSALAGLHILVVDDEVDARELVTVMLEQNGAQVTAAGSVAAALSLLTSEESVHPDVIVSDIGMPEENGYTLIRKVRRLPAAQGGQIPAIALTAFGRASDRIAALSAGFQMHVPKPVEAAELVMVIASLTGRAEPGKNV